MTVNQTENQFKIIIDSINFLIMDTQCAYDILKKHGDKFSHKLSMYNISMDVYKQLNVEIKNGFYSIPAEILSRLKVKLGIIEDMMTKDEYKKDKLELNNIYAEYYKLSKLIDTVLKTN